MLAGNFSQQHYDFWKFLSSCRKICPRHETNFFTCFTSQIALFSAKLFVYALCLRLGLMNCLSATSHIIRLRKPSPLNQTHSLHHDRLPKVEPFYSKRTPSTNHNTGKRCPWVVACGRAKQSCGTGAPELGVLPEPKLKLKIRRIQSRSSV